MTKKAALALFSIAVLLGSTTNLSSRPRQITGGSLPFPAAVTVGGASVTSNNPRDTATATFAVSGNLVTINLHNIPDAPRRLTINLTNVSDGTTSNTIAIPMGLLLGDTTGDGNTNSSDIAQTKSKSGRALSATNFRADGNIDDALNASDIALVKSKSGTALP